jgi:hypothetical protein
VPSLACFVPSAYADAMESFDGTAEHGKLEFACCIGTGDEDTSFGLAVAFGDGRPCGGHSVLVTLVPMMPLRLILRQV